MNDIVDGSMATMKDVVKVFLGAQAFDVVWTLALAWMLFGGVLLPVPDLR